MPKLQSPAPFVSGRDREFAAEGPRPRTRLYPGVETTPPDRPVEGNTPYHGVRDDRFPACFHVRSTPDVNRHCAVPGDQLLQLSLRNASTFVLDFILFSDIDAILVVGPTLVLSSAPWNFLLSGLRLAQISLAAPGRG
jgi:hypothetical protein